jgi:putative transposase
LQIVSANKKLLQINRALIRAIAIKQFMTKYIACIKDKLRRVPQTIVGNITKVIPVFGLTKTLRLLQLPYKGYLKLKRKTRCGISIFHLCRIKHPAQILQKEIAIVKTYCKDERYLHWPLSSVYHQIIRDGVAHMHISTFYKYVSLLGLKRRMPPHRRKNHQVGIRATKPLDILHADASPFRTADNHKSHIQMVQDNYSRAILQLSAHTSCTAQNTFNNIEQVCKEFLLPSGIEHCQLITDDGSENYGPVKDFLNDSKYPVIQHLIAQKDITFSNSMIEAINKQIKYRFLYHKHIADHTALVNYLPMVKEEYNNRPHHALHGLTPSEVLRGQIPNKQAHSAVIQKAKVSRIAENKKIKCCSYSF